MTKHQQCQILNLFLFENNLYLQPKFGCSLRCFCYKAQVFQQVLARAVFIIASAFAITIQVILAGTLTGV